MLRLLGVMLICVSIAMASVALVIFGPPIRHIPGPPTRTVGNVTHSYSNVERTLTAHLVAPLLAVFASGVVLLVLPRPKRRDLPPTGGAP